MAPSALLRIGIRWGLVGPALGTLVLYGALWLAGVEFVPVTILLAFVCLSPGCLILGWQDAGTGALTGASSSGTVLDAETRQSAGSSMPGRVVPLGFFLTGVGVYAIVITALTALL